MHSKAAYRGCRPHGLNPRLIAPIPPGCRIEIILPGWSHAFENRCICSVWLFFFRARSRRLRSPAGAVVVVQIAVVEEKIRTEPAGSEDGVSAA
jgi:hypothetical protein